MFKLFDLNRLYRVKYLTKRWDDDYRYACIQKGMKLINIDDDEIASMLELRIEINRYLQSEYNMSNEQR